MIHITYVILWYIEYPQLSSQNRTKIKKIQRFKEGWFSVLFCWLTFLLRFSLIPLTQIKPNVAVVILSWFSYIVVLASSAISSNDTVFTKHRYFFNCPVQVKIFSNYDCIWMGMSSSTNIQNSSVKSVSQPTCTEYANYTY